MAHLLFRDKFKATLVKIHMGNQQEPALFHVHAGKLAPKWRQQRSQRPKRGPTCRRFGFGAGRSLWPLSVAVICGSGLWQPAPQGPTPPARQPWRDPLKSRHAPSPRVLGRRATTLCGLSGLSGLCWIFWAPCAARSDGTRQGLLPPGRPLAFGQRLIECLRQGLGQIAKDRALARLNFSRRGHARLDRHPLAGAR